MIAILRKELRDAVRNRWLLGYAVLLAALGLVSSWAGLQASEGLALQTYGRTAATLTNLCLLLAPLVSLLLGAAAIAGERDRGTLEYLLAQPLTRSELLLGKYVALFAALAAATVVGFAPGGLLIAARAGGGALLHFLVFPLLALLLIAAMLAVGLALSAKAASGVAAQGYAMLAWFTCVLLYDLVVLGVLASAQVTPGLLAALLVVNPVDAGRVLVVLALEPDLYLLGPAGAWLIGELGPAGAATLLVASLVGWTGLALATASFLFRAPTTRPRGRAADAADLVAALALHTSQLESREP